MPAIHSIFDTPNNASSSTGGAWGNSRPATKKATKSSAPKVDANTPGRRIQDGADVYRDGTVLPHVPTFPRSTQAAVTAPVPQPLRHTPTSMRNHMSSAAQQRNNPQQSKSFGDRLKALFCFA